MLTGPVNTLESLAGIAWRIQWWANATSKDDALPHWGLDYWTSRGAVLGRKLRSERTKSTPHKFPWLLSRRLHCGHRCHCHRRRYRTPPPPTLCLKCHPLVNPSSRKLLMKWCWQVPLYFQVCFMFRVSSLSEVFCGRTPQRTRVSVQGGTTHTLFSDVSWQFFLYIDKTTSEHKFEKHSPPPQRKPN